MRVSENRYERDVRKHRLAKWMIAHGARTHTLTQWTGLSRYRVQALFRSYHETRDNRRRGISPFQSAYFGKSLGLEAESLAFAFIAYEMDVIPEPVVIDARRALPGLARGERLMMAFEMYRALVPEAHISLERAILFVIELSERRQLYLRRCRTCPDAMVVDRFGPHQDQCPFCRSEHQLGPLRHPDPSPMP